MTPAMFMVFGVLASGRLVPAIPAGGGRRRLPRRRRATIERHIEVLRHVGPVPAQAARRGVRAELSIARKSLADLDSLGYLLENQDLRLVALYRQSYMDALRREDDEWIIWMA